MRAHAKAERSRRPITTLQRYVFLQLPGWILAAIVLYWLRLRLEISWPVAVGLWATWVGKDFALYPFVRSAYETRVATGATRLVGRTAVVVRAVAPIGQVRIDGEIWQARTADGRTVERGRTVEVLDAEGLTLVVSETETEPGQAGVED